MCEHQVSSITCSPHCIVCSVRSDELSICGRCLTTYYCSIACQKQHWTNGHRKNCVKAPGCALCNKQSTRYCETCKACYYCSASCKSIHWNIDHRFICGNIRRDPNNQYNSVRAMMILNQAHDTTPEIASSNEKKGELTVLIQERIDLELLEKLLLIDIDRDPYKDAANNVFNKLQSKYRIRIFNHYIENRKTKGEGAVLILFNSIDMAYEEKISQLRYIKTTDFFEYKLSDSYYTQVQRDLESIQDTGHIPTGKIVYEEETMTNIFEHGDQKMVSVIIAIRMGIFTWYHFECKIDTRKRKTSKKK